MRNGWLARVAIISAVLAFPGCAAQWPMFRYDITRSASQVQPGSLTDPLYVSSLQVVHSDDLGLPAEGARFRASPVVHDGKVFIGNSNGYFYALNADTLKKIWQYPPAGQPGLRSKYEGTCGVGFHTVASTFGISSSAVIARVRNARGRLRDAVVFAAPDPSLAPGLGHGVLIALNINSGALLRKSAPLGRLTGLSPGSRTEFHEQLGYSAPLYMDGRIYVGVADHCDNPIQKGRVVAVHAGTLEIDPAFQFCSTGKCGDTSTRGGGVWSPVAGYPGSVFVTTGNTREYGDPAVPEPCPNHGLSMLRLDAKTGRIVWRHRPVSFALDKDPDWAAGATVFDTGCGKFAVSTQKDGWTHAVRFGSGAPETSPADQCPPPPSVVAPWQWVFPPNALPFQPGDGTTHPDTQYKRPGAVLYNGVYVTMAAGWSAKYGNLRSGYHRLHAFHVCSSNDRGRLRWILDVPGVTGDCADPPPWDREHGHFEGTARNCLGPPTTAEGIVFVTTNGGHLVAAGDPATGVPYTTRCAIVDLPMFACAVLGSDFEVAEPGVILDLPLNAGSILTEPVLVKGRVYVATDGGRVLMLAGRR
jgi:outer membrane protein assembly factor BamB